MLNSIGRAEVDMATEVGRFNVSKWQSAFNDAVERLNDAVGENFEDHTEWRSFDVWSMFGAFICTRSASQPSAVHTINRLLKISSLARFFYPNFL